MTYDLAIGFQRTAFLAKTEDLLARCAKVELTEKTARTRAQNSYLHLILGAFAMETGNTLDYVKTEYYKAHINRDLFVTERTDTLLGKKVQVLKSSRELTKEQMALSIDRFKRWANENGIYLPEPGDTALLLDIEMQMGRMKNYL